MSAADLSFHYVPHCDEKPHDLSMSCWCCPRPTWQDLETNETLPVPLIVHNAADCRELVEAATGDGYGGWEVWQVHTAPPVRNEHLEDLDMLPRKNGTAGDTPAPGPELAGGSDDHFEDILPEAKTDDSTWRDSADDDDDDWESTGEDWKNAA